MIITAARKDEVIHTIVQAARTGQIGDGKIFVYDVGEAIRIRNEERGDAAL
jgi:nitrogen regulatory protein P-II 1